jgi:hypothetical protein
MFQARGRRSLLPKRPEGAHSARLTRARLPLGTRHHDRPDRDPEPRNEQNASDRGRKQAWKGEAQFGRGAQRGDSMYETYAQTALPVVIQMRREDLGRQLAIGGEIGPIEHREITDLLHRSSHARRAQPGRMEQFIKDQASETLRPEILIPS